MFHRARVATFAAVARPTILPSHAHRFVSPGFQRLAYSTSSTASHRKRPSAIAQRLPDPDEVHAPHRFREFEVRQIELPKRSLSRLTAIHTARWQSLRRHGRGPRPRFDPGRSTGGSWWECVLLRSIVRADRGILPHRRFRCRQV